MTNNSWHLNKNSSLSCGRHEASAEEVLQALSENEGNAIRSSLPEIRFAKTKPLRVNIEFSGQFPNSIRAKVGVIKNNTFYPWTPKNDNLIINKTWHPVEPTSMKKITELLESGTIKDETISSSDYFSLFTDPEFNQLIRRVEEELHEENWETDNFLNPPSSLKANLYPYQLAGSSRLRKLAEGGLGCLLGDEMGLGKTIQVITLMLALKENEHGPLDPYSTMLVVAPSSLLLNWKKELEKFAPSLNSLIHAGPNRTGVQSGLTGHDVVIVSYETLLNDLAFFDDVAWKLVALDEAQQIRNPDSRRAVAVKTLDRRISVAVTGTPVENTLGDLWSVAEFILPPLLGARESFEELFPDEEIAAYHLGEVVSPIVIRRRVADVATDLPEKIEFPTPLHLDPDDEEEHRRISDSGTAFETDMKLRVFCAHAGEITDAEFRASPKVSHVLNVLEEIFQKNEKVLIFTTFKNTIFRLLDMISSSKDVYTGVIMGDVAPEERHLTIDEFEEYHGPGCLFLNPQAGGVGLNITAANHVIHFNPEYNPAVTSQATARSYRRGQSRPVFVHHLYYENSIEEKAMTIQRFKEDLAEGLDQGVSLDD